jgi:TniQ
MSRVKARTAPNDVAVRWWIPGSGDDESLRSIVERAERLYGGEGDAFRRRLWPRATRLPDEVSSLDMLSARELCELARMIGVRPRTLFAHRLEDTPMLLKPSERRAYCPACWMDERNAGRPPVFQRAWAGVFALRCEVHDLPLHWSSPHLGTDAAVVTPTHPQSAEGVRILRFIETFARHMEQSLRGQATWPREWRGDAYTARGLLMRCVVNLGCMLEHPPFASVAAPPDLSVFIKPPARRVEPLREAPWDLVRALGPPAWRRAALWMVSRYVIPAPKPGYLPEGLPAEAFAALDAQWEGLPPSFRGLRRTRRYREALKASCRPYPVGRDG